LEKQQLLELKREQEAELRRRKEAEEERRADLRTKIYMLTAAYRKTQPELIDLTVQVALIDLELSSTLTLTLPLL